MARPAAAPFERGRTWGASATTDAVSAVGREWVFEDIDYSVSGNTKPVRSNRPVTVRAVRNQCTVGSGGDVTTGALRPSRLVTFLSGSYNTAIDGYARTTAQGPTYPVDEFIKSAGVSNLDVFYIVVKGPAMVLTDIAQVVDINYNDSLVALTAATSGATTSGHVAGAVYTNLTSQNLVDTVRNCIGRALSAATSGNTNTGILADIGYSCC